MQNTQTEGSVITLYKFYESQAINFGVILEILSVFFL